MGNVPLPDGAVVALYHPLPDELDTAPLAEALLERNIAIALPAIARRKAPLVFRRFNEGDRLVEGPFRTLEPVQDAEAVTPQIVVAPLLGFTRAGARLGYGGGYYDRTLAALRGADGALAIGYAYGAQEVDALPTDARDQPLDWIVTEREAIRAQGNG